MKSNLYSIVAYLRYLVQSRTSYSVHSPFVFSLVGQVINDHSENQSFTEIADLRDALFRNARQLEITDFGTGSGSREFIHRFASVSSIARNSGMNNKYGKLLYRLVAWFKPHTIIEIGTSLGLSTTYLAKAAPKANIFTIEGCATKSQQAASNFNKLGISNVEVQIGSFNIVLPALVKKTASVDFVFIDGNHSYKPTLSYFRLLLQIAHNDTVFVFDDIHWSPEMTKAWKEIINHEHVTVSVDLFRMGIVFIRKELSKQHFVIRY